MPQEKSAGAIIFRKEPSYAKATEGKDNQIYYLLLHYQSGHWEFPKGHIEKGENETDTVKREVGEETELKDIRIIDGFKQYIKYFFKNTYNFANEEKKKAPWVFKLVVFYLAQTQTKEIKISFEHQGYKWLPYEEAITQLTFKNAKEILKKANDFILSKKDS